jgi:hypothetical protein
MKELVVPPAAQQDEHAVEILRAWVAAGAQWVSLNPHLYRGRDFDEEWAWGLFLADTIKHVANAIAAETGKDPQKTAKAIQKSFAKEMKKPTTAVKGGYLEDSDG